MQTLNHSCHRQLLLGSCLRLCFRHLLTEPGQLFLSLREFSTQRIHLLQVRYHTLGHRPCHLSHTQLVHHAAVLKHILFALSLQILHLQLQIMHTLIQRTLLPLGTQFLAARLVATLLKFLLLPAQ